MKKLILKHGKNKDDNTGKDAKIWALIPYGDYNFYQKEGYIKMVDICGDSYSLYTDLAIEVR